MYELNTVIWDFNGTILDDLALVVRTINTLLRARQLEPTTIERHRQHFGFPVERYYRGLGFNLEEEPFGEISREYHDHYLAGLSSCPVHPGAARLLEHLHERGLRQFVLSAMQQQLLDQALRELGADRYFDGIYGLDDLMARSKVERGRTLFAEHAVEPHGTLYIGDTDHDVEVARALGCISVGVAVGHQAMARFDPDHTHVVGDFEELAAYLDGSQHMGRGRILFTPPGNGAG